MSRLFLIVFINTVLEDRGQIQLLLYPFPGCFVHFVQNIRNLLFFEVTIFIKSWLQKKNTRRPVPFSWIPHCIHRMSRLTKRLIRYVLGGFLTKLFWIQALYNYLRQNEPRILQQIKEPWTGTWQGVYKEKERSLYSWHEIPDPLIGAADLAFAKLLLV